MMLWFETRSKEFYISDARTLDQARQAAFDYGDEVIGKGWYIVYQVWDGDEIIGFEVCECDN